LLRLRTLAGCVWIVGDRVLSLAPEVGRAAADLVDHHERDAHWPTELLQGMDPAGCQELADWLLQARAQRRTGQLRWLGTQARQAQAQQRLDDALVAVQTMLMIKPHAEEHHRALTQLHYLGHDTARALAAYEQLRQELAREFGVQPSAQTLALAQLLSVAFRSAVAATAPVPTPAHEALALQRPPVLAGRQAELAQLRQADGQGGGLLLWAEAGMGKSRLLAEAASGQARTLQVKAQAGDAGVPFSLLARLLRRPGLCMAQDGGRSGRHIAALAQLLPELAADSAIAAPPADRLALFEAVEQSLADSALRLLVVDDIHFADEASLDMLTALVSSERLPRLTWFFAQRPDNAPPACARLRDLLGRAHWLRKLLLPALDADAMTSLLQSLQLPGLDAAAWAPRMLRHTGGNPLFTLETLKQLGSMPALADALPQPLSVRAVLEKCLTRLSPTAQSLARLAAVAEPSFNAALAASVLQRPAVDLGDA